MDLVKSTLKPDKKHMKKTRHLVSELQAFKSSSEARSQKFPEDLKIRIDNILKKKEKMDSINMNQTVASRNQ
jgi:hypothetical protein